MDETEWHHPYDEHSHVKCHISFITQQNPHTINSHDDHIAVCNRKINDPQEVSEEDTAAAAAQCCQVDNKRLPLDVSWLKMHRNLVTRQRATEYNEQ